MGFVSLYTTHLGFGGQEVVVVGLTTEGLKRAQRQPNGRALKQSSSGRSDSSDSSDSVKKIVKKAVKGVGKSVK